MCQNARAWKDMYIYSRTPLTLLRYHEKSYVNSTMGSIWPHFKKKQNKSTVFYNYFFPQIIFYNTGLYSHIDKYTRLCLGTFKYIEADREIYKKWITKSKEYSTTLHVWVSDYFTYSIIICRSHFYSWHWLLNHLLCSSHTNLLHSLHMNLVFLSFDLGQM